MRWAFVILSVPVRVLVLRNKTTRKVKNCHKHLEYICTECVISLIYSMYILVLSPCYISLDGQLSFHPDNVLFAHVFMLFYKILLLLL